MTMFGSESSDPIEVSVDPIRSVTCLRCQIGMDFLGHGQYQIDDPEIASGTDLLVYRCPSCRKVEFFEDLEDEPEEIECLSCGAVIPVGETACPQCGWTWASMDASAEENV